MPLTARLSSERWAGSAPRTGDGSGSAGPGVATPEAGSASAGLDTPRPRPRDHVVSNTPTGPRTRRETVVETRTLKDERIFMDQSRRPADALDVAATPNNGHPP